MMLIAVHEGLLRQSEVGFCAVPRIMKSTPDRENSDIFDQIVAYAAGKPINVVNPKVLAA